MFTFVIKFKALKIYQREPDEGHHETISLVLQLIKIYLAQKTAVLSLPKSVRGTVMIVVGWQCYHLVNILSLKKICIAEVISLFYKLCN